MSKSFLDYDRLVQLLGKLKDAFVAPFVKDVGGTGKIQLGSSGTDITEVNPSTAWANSSISSTGHIVAAYKNGNDSVHRLAPASSVTVGKALVCDKADMVDYCHIQIVGETQDASHTHTIGFY